VSSGVARTFVLRAPLVLDEAGGFGGPLDVLVVEGRVAEVGRNVIVSTGTAEYDFTGLWLMPGVFDCHDHIAWSTTNESELLRTPYSQWVLETAVNLCKTLEAGVTFVRDAAGADVGIRTAVERGFVPGPQLQISVNLLCQTGGHGDQYFEGLGHEWGYTPEWLGRPATLVDGTDEMRKTVRQLLRGGVDWIKLCATGGIVSPHDSGDEQQLTFEEIQTAVVEAKRKRKPVMAHAFGGPGLKDAVRAGVRSIEHGLFMTEQDAELMASAGCWLVPTLSISHDLVRWARERGGESPNPLPDYSVDKALKIEALIGRQVEIAKAAGVKMAIGTDYINREEHGRNLEELLHMRRAGLTPEETLRAATIGGAELCGVGDRYGRIAPGYAFDAIVLECDPGDLSVFAEPGVVTGVFKSGKAVVSHPRLESVASSSEGDPAQDSRSVVQATN
jgi:imidazolonepropionase-like amidohydrolase